MATKKTKPSSGKKTTSPKSSATKTAKRTTPTKAAVVSDSAVSTTATPTSSSTRSTSRMPFKVRRLYLVIALVVIALAGLIAYYRSAFVVAVVNGQPISRLAYMHETESVYLQDQRVTAGKQALNQLVTKTLLEQEASRRHISVSDKEVSDEVTNTRNMLKKQGQKLEDALALQGDTLSAYEDRIRTQKLIQKLVGTVTVSDKEINDSTTQNKSSLPQDLTGNDLKTQVKQTLESQKSNEKLQALIQSLQQKAKVTYLVSK
ncbi:hypothetical protein BH09PAT1_BH09PAT1_8050 [soil metagenome]